LDYFIGKKFGRLKVLHEVPKPAHLKKKQRYWKCSCSCGNIVIVPSTNLKNGNSKSCGCLRKKSPPNKMSLAGNFFGRLFVICEAGRDKQQRTRWKCRCECGNICIVNGYNLKNKDTQSCGCIQKEKNQKRKEDMIGKKFGRITVLEFAGKKNRCYRYFCRCDCGNEFVIFGYSLRRSTRPTRSCGCLQKEYAKNNKGKNNPSWKGGKNKHERQKDKGMYEYKKFRKSVLQRDKRCVLCKKSNELIVHHLNGYHWFEEGRYDVENGITLCQECHIKFHRKFGNRDNTKEQFYEWSNNEIEL
jgi:hypothetical protein